MRQAAQWLLSASQQLLLRHSRRLRWRHIVMFALLCLIALLCPLSSQATVNGSWQATSVGPTLSQRGLPVVASALQAPESLSAVIRHVVWRYQLNRPAPAGLQTWLCAADRCITLQGQTGTTSGLAGLPASQPLQFIWEMTGSGPLLPVIQVLSQQVIVNYQQ